MVQYRLLDARVMERQAVLLEITCTNMFALQKIQSEHQKSTHQPSHGPTLTAKCLMIWSNLHPSRGLWTVKPDSFLNSYLSTWKPYADFTGYSYTSRKPDRMACLISMVLQSLLKRLIWLGKKNPPSSQFGTSICTSLCEASGEWGMMVWISNCVMLRMASAICFSLSLQSSALKMNLGEASILLRWSNICKINSLSSWPEVFALPVQKNASGA